MATLLELATLELGKTPEQKAIAALTEKVEDNKVAFITDLHHAKKAVSAAEKAVAYLSTNPNASARQIIDADDALAVAKKEVEQITAIMSSRF
jgi:hypothetical protein